MHATNTPRYDKVATFLHWTIALLIIALLFVGLTMEDYPVRYKILTYNFHKSTGLLVLVLSFFRLYWRLTHEAPPFPDHMSSFEKSAAKATHWFFYFLIIAMPLSGWIMVSANAKHPTIFYTLFEVPQFPLPAIYDTHATREQFEALHYYLAMVAIGLIVLHVGAALKHHFMDHDAVLRRMLPLWAQRRGKAIL